MRSKLIVTFIDQIIVLVLLVKYKYDMVDERGLIHKIAKGL